MSQGKAVVVVASAAGHPHDLVTPTVVVHPGTKHVLQAVAVETSVGQSGATQGAVVVTRAVVVETVMYVAVVVRVSVFVAVEVDTETETEVVVAVVVVVDVSVRVRTRVTGQVAPRIVVGVRVMPWAEALLLGRGWDVSFGWMGMYVWEWWREVVWMVEERGGDGGHLGGASLHGKEAK